MFVQVLDAELYRAEKEAGGFRPRHQHDAGIDLRSKVDIRVHAAETVKIPLGVAVDISPGYVGWMTGRSSTCLEFGLFTHEGKIDAGYRGEIHTFVTALGSPVDIKRGERVAQLVVVAILDPEAVGGEWPIVEDLGESERGLAGLGSTGRM
jgi:dUTP pyrophosphatase